MINVFAQRSIEPYNLYCFQIFSTYLRNNNHMKDFQQRAFKQIIQKPVSTYRIPLSPYSALYSLSHPPLIQPLSPSLID